MIQTIGILETIVHSVGDSHFIPRDFALHFNSSSAKKRNYSYGRIYMMFVACKSFSGNNMFPYWRNYLHQLELLMTSRQRYTIFTKTAESIDTELRKNGFGENNLYN